MSAIPSFPYSAAVGRARAALGREPHRADARDFFAVASKAGIVTRTRTFPLARANEAIAAHRAGA